MLAAGCNANLRIDSDGSRAAECLKRPDAEACLEQVGSSDTDEFLILNDESITNHTDLKVIWEIKEAFDDYHLDVATDVSCRDKIFSFDNLTSGSKKIAFLKDGHYYICMSATNGNERKQAKNNGLKITIDTTPPKVTLPEAISVNAPFWLDPTISDLTKVNVTYTQVTGAPSLSVKNEGGKNRGKFSADGIFLIKGSFVDAAGNESSALMSVNWDTTPPVVDLGANFTRGAPVQLNATVGADAAAFEWSSSAGVIFSSTTIVNPTISAPANGVYEITLTAKDVLGNTASDSVTFTWHVPTVTVTSTVINNANKSAVSLDGTCSENGRLVNIGGDRTGSAPCLAGVWNATVDYSGTSDGNIRVTVDHADEWGAPAAQAVVDLVKDTGLPSVTINNTNIANSNKSSYSLTGTCSENGRSITIEGAVATTAVCFGGTWSVNVDYSGQPDGTVSVTANQADAAGNGATQAAVNLVKDTDAATVSIDNIIITNSNESAVPLSGSCSEDGRTVTIGGAVSSSAICNSGSWAVNVDYSGRADGSVTVTADHADAVGNFAVQAVANLTKDTVLPTVTINNSPITDSNKAAYILSGTCSESGRNVTIGGTVSSFAPCVLGTWSVTVDYSAASDGPVAVTADHTDANGNAAVQASQNLTKDTGVPTVSVTSTAVINNANKSAYTLTGTCSEGGTSVVIGGAVATTVNCNSGTWSLNIDYSTAAEGTVSVTANHSDAVGNVAVQATATLVKDTILPTVTIANLMITAANHTSVPLTGTCSEDGQTVTIGGPVSQSTTCIGGTWSVNVDLSGVPDGIVSVTADHSDVAGNNAPQATRNLVKNTNIVVVTIDSVFINNQNKSAVPLSGSCSEDGHAVTVGGAVSASATCTGGSWTVAADFSAQSDGSVSITADHDDGMGISASQATASLTKDTLLPTVTITSNGNIVDGNKTSYTLAGTCSENGRTIAIGGGVIASTACISGSWSAVVNYSGVADGSVSVTADGDDAAGNEAAQASTTLTKDTAVPLVTITNLNITSANKNSYPLSGTCSENGRAVTLGGAVSASATCNAGSWTVNVDYGTQADGSVIVTADHNDAAGNNAVQGNLSLTKDTVLPIVSIQSNAVINDANKASYLLSGTCSEAGRTVSIGGAVTTSTTCAAGAWSVSVNYTAQSDGSVAVTADHGDAAGNAAAQATASLTKDVGLPVVTIADGEINLANKSSYSLTGTCSEAGRTVSIGGAVSGTAACNAGSWALTMDYSGQSDGAVAVTADHSDAAGNAATQASTSLEKDTVAPSVSITSSLPINNTNKAAYPLTGACSENGRTVTIGGAVNTSAPCVLGSWSVNVNYGGEADGAISITVDLMDAVGNVATQAATNLTKDVGVPTVTITSAVDISDANKTAYALAGTCSESGLTVTIGGAVTSSSICAAGLWSLNIDFSGVPDGQVAVLADHSDAAGNSATQASTNLTKDTGIPTVAITSTQVINNANKGAYPLQGTCSENGRSVAIGGDVSTTATCNSGSWNVNVNFSAVSDGPVSVIANHSDASGNDAPQSSVSLNKDTGLPTVSIASTEAINGTNKFAYSLAGTCSESGQTVTIGGAVSATTNCIAGFWNLAINYSGVADGSVSVTADHSDVSGNNAIQAMTSLNKDTAIPTLSITSSATIYSANAASYPLGGNCSEDGRTVTVGGAVSTSAPCVLGTWSVNVNYSSIADGSVSVTADLSDSAGNYAVQASRTLAKDAAPPTVSIASTADIVPANEASYPLSGSCSENGRTVTIGGAVATSATCNSGSWAVNVDYASQADGSISITATHTDVAGNSSQANKSLTKETSPWVTINPGATISPANMTAYTLSGTCSETGRNVTIGGAVASSAVCSSGTWSVNVNYSSSPDGSVAVTANHSNAKGEAAPTASLNLTKDTTGPTATINGQPSGSSSVTSLNITIGGTDVTHYKYKIDSYTIDCASPSDYSAEKSVSTKITDNIAVLAPGKVKLCVIGRDAVGNYQTTASTVIWTKTIDHRVFITSTNYSGNLGGLAGANNKCQARAAAVSLPGYWGAIISTSAQDAKSIPLSGAVRNMAGQTVSTTASGMWGSIDVAIGYDEIGDPVSKKAWTGTDLDGSEASPFLNTWTCLDFTNSSSANRGAAGESFSTSYNWMYATSGGIPMCDSSFGLYCIEMFNAYPPKLTSIEGTTNGKISLTVRTPPTVYYYNKVDVRRVAGLVPPSDCADGSIVYSVTTSSASTSYAATDTGTAGAFYSYRACVYDSDNRLLNETAVLRGARAKGGTQNYHRAFVTSTVSDGNWGGLSNMDSYCQNVANSASLGSTWKALASGATINAKDRLIIQGPVRNMGGAVIAVDAVDLWDGNIDAAVAYDESGNLLANQYFWTGSQTSGVKSAVCTDWAVTTGIGNVGETTARDVSWLNAASSGCQAEASLLCLEQNIIP